ncbi:MAG: hypothetical protein IKH75_01365 [Ruminococcus sp.]|nr:hypothetical protein [Ruminococcus sp.]
MDEFGRLSQEEMEEMQKTREAADSDEMLLRTFVMNVGFDYHQDYRPHLQPEFSEKTKFLWEEVEKRMKGTRVLGFNREKCLNEITEAIRNQEQQIRHGADYTTSYHVGIKSGLNTALRIVEDCLTYREEGGEKE